MSSSAPCWGRSGKKRKVGKAFRTIHVAFPPFPLFPSSPNRPQTMRAVRALPRHSGLVVQRGLKAESKKTAAGRARRILKARRTVAFASRPSPFFSPFRLLLTVTVLDLSSAPRYDPRKSVQSVVQLNTPPRSCQEVDSRLLGRKTLPGFPEEPFFCGIFDPRGSSSRLRPLFSAAALAGRPTPAPAPIEARAASPGSRTRWPRSTPATARAHA